MKKKIVSAMLCAALWFLGTGASSLACNVTVVNNTPETMVTTINWSGGSKNLLVLRYDKNSYATSDWYNVQVCCKSLEVPYEGSMACKDGPTSGVFQFPGLRGCGAVKVTIDTNPQGCGARIAVESSERQ